MILTTCALTLLLFFPSSGAVSPYGALDVPANGNHSHVSVSFGAYQITVNGTYLIDNRLGHLEDANCGEVDSTGWHNWANDNGDLMIDGVSRWGTTCASPGDAYSTTYVCNLLSCSIDFYIKDGDYSDNSGSLHVVIQGA